MIRFIYTFIFAFIWAFFFFEIYSVYFFLDINSSAVLTTPYDNLIISLRPDLFKDFFYYRLYEINRSGAVDLSNWIFALSPIMAAVIFFQLSFLYLLLFAKIRQTENSFILFSIIISIQYILFFDLITYHRWEFYYYLFTFLSNAGFVYLFLTLLNRKLPFYVYLAAIGGLTLIAYYFFPMSAFEEIRILKIMGVTHLVTFFGAFGVFLYDERNPAAEYKVKNRRIRRMFLLISLSMIVLPGVSYLVPIYYNINISMFINLIFYIPALFPMVLMIFSLHNNYIFFNKPVRTWYLRLVYFIFFIFLYALIVGFESLLVLRGTGNLWLHVISVFVFIFIFDALRLLSEISINYYLNYRKFVFDEHITDIFQFLQTPFQFEDGIERFLKMIEAGCGAGKVTIVFSEDLFGGWLREKYNIKFVPDDDPIWRFQKRMSFFSRARVVSLSRGGFTEIFLNRHAAVLMMFFARFKVAILLTEKVDGSPYLTEDLNYINDLMRQTEPILENYKLLIDNIETKKFERELENVSQIQKKLKQPEIKNDRVTVQMYNQPSKFVTGDYMEVFSLAKDRYLLLLGDVSGHSLASAYFMGLVRSMIDGLTKSKKYSIREIFHSINSVLCDKQSSSSFMTLCAIEIVLKPRGKDRQIELSYINAGQHSPVVYLGRSKELRELSGNQRVLGVVKSEYEETKAVFKEDLRLILTSDGAFEIFNARGEILGEQRFLEWIKESAEESPANQKDYLVKKIEQYSCDTGSLDDISILVVNITLQMD